jgi:hypothetical protein
MALTKLQKTLTASAEWEPQHRNSSPYLGMTESYNGEIRPESTIAAIRNRVSVEKMPTAEISLHPYLESARQKWGRKSLTEKSP